MSAYEKYKAELFDDVERLEGENRVMRKYIYSQGLLDEDIQMWIDIEALHDESL